MDTFRRRDEADSSNKARQKPPVPDLPEKKEELGELMKKRFEILWESRPLSERGEEYHPGGVAITNLLIKCPYCNMEFDGFRESGCFMNKIYPLNCPNCVFPGSVFKAWYKICRKEREERENS